METNKQKILVLTDLKKSALNVLKSTVSLAKMIDADIELFLVKKPTDVVDSENQLSSMRSINDDFKKTKKNIESLVNPLSKDYDVKINYTFTTGNIKENIKEQIDKVQPNVIVLGKRKSKLFSLAIDNITGYILNEFKGSILIPSDQNALVPEELLSLGILGGIKTPSNTGFTEQLLNNSQKPLKTFSLDQDHKVTLGNDVKTIDYTFENNANAVKNLSKYLQKSNVNLLYVDRESKFSTATEAPSINRLIEKLNVSLLIA